MDTTESAASAGVQVEEMIGKALTNYSQSVGKPLEERLKHLHKAQELLLDETTSSSVLDNFLTEMLEISREPNPLTKIFVLLFIEKACKKEPEVLIEAVRTLSSLMNASHGIKVYKKAIATCTQLYPVVLTWCAQKKTDRDAEACWTAFCDLKRKIMQGLDSDNEGVRTMSIKFVETVILCQSAKTDLSEAPRTKFHISLDEISRDHRYISYRQLESESQHSFNCLLDQMASTHISSLNLITVIACLVSICRQRPERLLQVITGLETLHVNLPPTLGISQVKSVRKELKMHLLRMLKHPASFVHHSRIQQLLVELGATQSEISRAMPAPGEVKEALQRRVAVATASSSAQSSQTRSADDGEPTSMEDSWRPKRFKLDEDDYVDDRLGAEAFTKLEDGESTANATQKAIEMTTDWVFGRLSTGVVAKLVMISLYTLPTEMPAAFQSSYTPIDQAGSEQQRRHLAKMLAIQLTNGGEGPGAQFIREEKQKQFMARQAARMEGAVIPPTPMHPGIQSSAKGEEARFSQPQLPARPKTKIQQFSLLTETKELLLPEANKLIALAFKRILDNEKRAVQGGAGADQQKLLVRLVTRYHSHLSNTFEEQLIGFIVQDQKARTDLALLWIAELYAQMQGFSICSVNKNDGRFVDLERYVRYDKALCNLVGTLFNRGEHKETLFHRIFLEVPLITPAAQNWLKRACVDQVYGAFAMTTLRELILTRARQRDELLKLLLEFSYSERADIKEHCVKTAKELYQIDYIRDDVRAYVIKMSEYLVEPTVPKPLLVGSGRVEEEDADKLGDVPWDEPIIRAALHLFIAVLPHDHSLLHQLASVCARTTNEIKRVTFRNIEHAIKAIGMQSEDLLDMIERCPTGAETLVARIVHLLTERHAPTRELVERVKALHQRRSTDVRSLIPILAGLDKDELMQLIPKFVLSATNGKSVPAFFSRLIFGRHIETHAPLLSPTELLLELHKIKPDNIKERSHLTLNLDLLLVDRAREYQLAKDVFANAIEALVDEEPLPPLLYHTLEKIHENYPALNGFLSNILVKIASKGFWRENPETWPTFVRCARALGSVAFMAVISHLNLAEFQEYLQDHSQPVTVITLRNFIALLSAHQQNQVKREILDHVNEEARKIDGLQADDKGSRISISAH